MDFKTSDVLFFFGAGASAPFGIPTMKEFVVDFEADLKENGTEEERNLYTKIKSTLSKRLGKEVDLEAVFTVIDGYMNFNFERLGLLSLYCFDNYISKMKKIPSPSYDAEVEICESLRDKFQNFVRNKCAIPDESFGKIRLAYRDFFNRFALELKADGVQSHRRFSWCNQWTLFTTNYDTSLEYYWRQVVNWSIDTGFTHDSTRGVDVLDSRRFLDVGTALKLLKLHGSISWRIEKGTNLVTEETTLGGRSLMGRRFVGEMMIYPIAEKELYLDPYISMLLRLNRELRSKSVWVVIGYSFNDPIIREIFTRNSNQDKHLILVHPHASDVKADRLNRIKGKVITMKEKFGLDHNFRLVNHQIIQHLNPNPRYDWNKTPYT